MGLVRLVIAGILVCTATLAADTAKDLVKKAQAAEKAGHVTDAYLLYSEAAAASADGAALWAKASSLKGKALAEVPMVAAVGSATHPPAIDLDSPLDPTIFGRITEKDLREARELLPPPTLTPRVERRAIHINAPPKLAFEQVAKLFNYQVTFDPDFPQDAAAIRFDLDNANYLETLRALELATGSFVLPLTPTRLMVAKDTAQKRLELEPNVVVTLSLPQTTTVQDLTELARAVQQSMDLQRMLIDNSQRLILLRGPISKVRPAQQMYLQMLRSTPMVEIDIQILGFSKSLDASYGMRLPNKTQIMALGTNVFRLDKIASFTSLLGLGLSNLDLFATVSQSAGKSLLNMKVTAIEGMPVTMHIGDRYPIATSGYFGTPDSGASVGDGISYRPPPTFNFEDLGLNLKITPRVHGMDEISLELESDFKLLSGSSINDIPIISNRKFTSRVRLLDGEWAVVAGLLSTSEANTIAGIPGLLQIPLAGRLFSDNGKNSERGETLLILRPRLLSLPPSEWATETIATGPEGRPRIPL